MNEKQFLELSDRERNGFIAKFVFGLEEHRDWWWWDSSTLTFDDLEPSNPIMYCGPDFSTTWEGMGKGTEHANENGYSVNIWVHENESRAGIVNLENGDTWYTPCNEKSIMLNFFIAYMKALGVLE